MGLWEKWDLRFSPSSASSRSQTDESVSSPLQQLYSPNTGTSMSDMVRFGPLCWALSSKVTSSITPPSWNFHVMPLSDSVLQVSVTVFCSCLPATTTRWRHNTEMRTKTIKLQQRQVSDLLKCGKMVTCHKWDLQFAGNRSSPWALVRLTIKSPNIHSAKVFCKVVR